MRTLRALSALILIATVSLPLMAADKMKVEDLLAKHLESIGTAQARAAAKTRVAEGAAQMAEVIGGSSRVDGTATLLSDDHKLKLAISFPSTVYPGEQFVFDGNKTMVAFTNNAARSALGEFMFAQSAILREGLFGGTLFTAWPLLHVDDKQPKLRYEGLKKVGNRELHMVSYVPKKGGSNIDFRLYFEPETFRHVKTVYRLETVAAMGAGVSDHRDEVRYFLEEDFADFQTVDGLTLPTSWTIRFEVQPSKSGALQWKVKVAKISHNAVL